MQDRPAETRVVSADAATVFARLKKAVHGLKRAEVTRDDPAAGRLAVRVRPMLFGGVKEASAHVYEIETGETEVDVHGDPEIAARLVGELDGLR